MKRFKRYEYAIHGNIEWKDTDMDEGDVWEEFKQKINDESFWDIWNDGRMKDLIDVVKIVRVVEGYYDDEGKAHITNVTQKEGDGG